MRKELMPFLLLIYAISSTACANLVGLGYDDGQPDDGVWIDDLRGHAVVFTPPCDNWTLSEVAILGKLAPQPKSDMFVVEVWDRNLSLLSKSVDRPESYFGKNFTWSEVDILDVKVSGSFLVSFYEFAGVYLGADIGPASGRSVLTARNPNRIISWDVQNHSYNETNWMIRALGSSPAPAVSLKVFAEKASRGSPAKVQAMVTDPDDNLKNATFYIVDNKTREIVWSEMKDLKGSSAEAQFSWPGTMFQIAVDGKAEGPVFAVNNIGIPENMSDLLARSAPCILELEKNATVSALAYFGQDGKLNALIDNYGFTHYLSQEAVNRTKPGTDYMNYIKNNITIIKDTSKIGFFKEKVPSGPQDQGAAIIGPIALSGPLFNYGIKLKEAGAGAGDYIAVVEAGDFGLNAVAAVGDKAIKVM
jgi:hypothetical protein